MTLIPTFVGSAPPASRYTPYRLVEVNILRENRRCKRPAMLSLRYQGRPGRVGTVEGRDDLTFVKPGQIDGK